MRRITRADLNDAPSDAFLYCPDCGTRASANPGDYWNLPLDFVFACDCNEPETMTLPTPMLLVRERCELVSVLPECGKLLYEDGNAVAVCTEAHGTEHSHNDHDAAEAVHLGSARPLPVAGRYSVDESDYYSVYTSLYDNGLQGPERRLPTFAIRDEDAGYIAFVTDENTAERIVAVLAKERA